MPSRLLGLYRERIPMLEALRNSLEKETRDALSECEHIDRVSYRVKSAESFEAKATDPHKEPPYGDPLVEVEDQVAGRVIVFFLADLGSVHDRIARTFTTVEESQRRPKRDEEFGYESNHMICIIPPHLKPTGWEKRQDLPTTFELQVRTIFMHAYAEPQHDVAYKGPSDLPRDVRRELAWIAASAWGADRALERVRVWDSEGRSGTKA
jgi:GTP pyrophosphokinase